VNRALSSMFYRTLKLVAEIDIPLDAGDFCLLDRKVVDALVSLRERNRYLRGLRSWVCFRQAAVEFDRDARHGGVPKYRFWSSLGPALQAFVSFSTLPLRLATWLGFLTPPLGVRTSLAIVCRAPLPVGVSCWLSRARPRRAAFPDRATCYGAISTTLGFPRAARSPASRPHADS